LAATKKFNGTQMNAVRRSRNQKKPLTINL
jgi:hypothetical protein